MANSRLISVIIPTYNRASLVEKAIQSVLKQTVPVLEILVCDDGSTDNTREITGLYADSGVRFISCGRFGRPAGPRNIGIKEAKGEWVAFLDSDDEWNPQKTEKQLDCARLMNVAAVSGNASRYAGGAYKGPYFERLPRRFDLDFLLGTNYVICSSMMVRKDILQRCGGFPEAEKLKALEDYALWLRVSTYTGIGYVADEVVNYTDAPAQSLRAFGLSPEEQRKVVLSDFKEWILRSDHARRKRLAAKVNRNLKAVYPKRSLAGIFQFLKRMLRA